MSAPPRSRMSPKIAPEFCRTPPMVSDRTTDPLSVPELTITSLVSAVDPIE
ncbi:hypothetical protein MAA8898_04674 [Maliponia aquimaris]|uniref:Uncharacterized protein n=1 Tax=Maliponia aquimaris TaxID=1673631 RepID=A0A238L7G6_9RHOB|nr:hypothetical protein MAA8898_04674 [Maliponia aquimaris]